MLSLTWVAKLSLACRACRSRNLESLFHRPALHRGSNIYGDPVKDAAPSILARPHCTLDQTRIGSRQGGGHRVPLRELLPCVYFQPSLGPQCERDMCSLCSLCIACMCTYVCVQTCLCVMCECVFMHVCVLCVTVRAFLHVCAYVLLICLCFCTCVRYMYVCVHVYRTPTSPYLSFLCLAFSISAQTLWPCPCSHCSVAHRTPITGVDLESAGSFL